jgi:gliding motility-associated-like protein
MRLNYILSCCVVLGLFLWNQNSWAQSSIDEHTDKVKLDGSMGGERIQLPGIEDGCIEIEICGLEPGDAYSFYSGLIYSTTTFTPTLLSGGRVLEDQYPLKVQAVSECLSLELCIERPRETAVPYLSFGILNEIEAAPESSPRSDDAINWSGVPGIEELVRDVLIGGDCFDVHNVQAIGPDGGRGVFSNGMESIGIQEGVVLSTGNLRNIEGPNVASDRGNSLAGGGDDDLQSLTGTQVFDVVGIQFDFIPTSETATFRYVFASEEYCEFVGQGFNDVFGFFVSGPGISGDFENNAVNIALIPGTDDYVSIDNVNREFNSAFYFDNTPQGQEQLQNEGVCGPLLNQDGIAIELVEFDGFTAVFEAVVDVIPCEVYTIKMVVGDAVDPLYDSAVFLEAGSFDAGASARMDSEVQGTDGNVVYDNCHKGGFIISRVGTDNSEPVVVNLQFSDQSSAEPGVDFEPLPDSLIIPANVDSIFVPLNILHDTYSGGELSVIYELDFLCSCTNPYAEIIISEDPGQANIDAYADDFLSCANEEVLVIGEILTPDLITHFEWRDSEGNLINDGTDKIIVVSEPGDYFFIGYSEESGCLDTVITTVYLDREQPEVQIQEPELITCDHRETTLDGSGSSSGSDIVYQWTTTDGQIASGEDEIIATARTPGTYILDVINIHNGCISTDSVLIETDDHVPDLRIAPIEELNCERRNLVIDAGSSEPAGEITFQWEVLEGNATGDLNQNTLNVDEPGSYALEIVLERNQCTVRDTFEVFEDVETPHVEVVDDQLLPCDENRLYLSGSYANSGSEAELEWKTPDGNIISGINTDEIAVDAVGMYIFSVRNPKNSCSAKDTVRITRDEPTEINYELSQPVCPGDMGVMSVFSVEGGVFPYAYSIPGYNGGQANDHGLFDQLRPGDYKLKVVDDLGCKTSVDFHVEKPREIQVELPEQSVAELGTPFILDPQLNFPESEVNHVEWTPVDPLNCPDCLRPEVNLMENTTFNLYIEDIHGCPAEAETSLLLTVNTSIFVPNAFSPNGDGINDYLEIFADGSVKQIIDFQIYNRWGLKVYHNANFPPNENGIGWDGTIDGEEAQPGVYIFILEYELINGDRGMKHGEVTILR